MFHFAVAALAALTAALTVADGLQLSPEDSWVDLGVARSTRASNWPDRHDPSKNTTGDMCTKLPKLISLGPGHSGSTTLAWDLEQHPQLSYGKLKEHDFFRSMPYLIPFYDQTLSNSFNNYKSEFRVPCKTEFAMDFQTQTFILGNPAAQAASGRNFHGFDLGLPAVRQVRSRLGADIKFLMMIRDPVDYIYSFLQGPYQHVDFERIIQGKKHKGSLTQCLGISEKMSCDLSALVHTRACYADSLQAWLDTFPRKNFMFLRSEDFFATPQDTLDNITTFLGVDHKNYTEHELQPSGRRRHSSQKAFPDQLRKVYHQQSVNKDCKSRLERMTGLQFNWNGA